MANVYWTGDAATVAQVTTFTAASGAWESTEYVEIVIGSKAVRYTATGSSTDAQMATGLFNAIIEATGTGDYPEFAAISWEDNEAGVITGTGTPGVKFVATANENADTETFTASTTTAASGPNFASVAANWSGGAVPATGDFVIIADSDVDILYDVDTAFPIGSVQLAGFRIDASYTGKIGLPLINELGYEEYLPRYLKVGLDSSLTVPIGWGPGGGSSRLYLDFQTASTTTVKVFSTGQPEDADEEALRLLLVHAANVIEIASGSVGLAREPGQVSTVSVVRLQASDGQDGSSIFRAGSGCTLATIVAYGGEILTDCALTTVTLQDGNWLHTGGAVTTIVNTAGTLTDQSTGTIASYTGRAGSTYDHRSDFRAKTYTAVDLYAGATWLDPNAAANTYTGGIDLNQCRYADVIIDVGPNRRLTPGSVA